MTVVRENGRHTKYFYDWAGRLVRVEEWLDELSSYTTHYDYDLAGNLIAVTNPVGQTTVNAYDRQNRLATTTHADDASESYGYDPVDHLLWRQDRAGQYNSFAYEA